LKIIISDQVFDGALRDLSEAAGIDAAASAAKMIDYPAPAVAGPAVRWQGVRAGVLLAVTACLAAALSVMLHRRWRR
jgi:hypothetical protein